MKSKTKATIDIISKATEEHILKKPPEYCPWKPKFYCPLSPQVPWHMGLVYKECPVNEEQRDMGHCAECHLRGKDTFKMIKKADKRRKRPYKKKKNTKKDKK